MEIFLWVKRGMQEEENMSPKTQTLNFIVFVEISTSVLSCLSFLLLWQFFPPLAVLKWGKDWSEEMGHWIQCLSARHAIQPYLSFSWWLWVSTRGCRKQACVLLPSEGARAPFHGLWVAVRDRGGIKRPCGDSRLQFCLLPVLGFTLCESTPICINSE